MARTLKYGYKVPEAGDEGSTVFEALSGNIGKFVLGIHIRATILQSLI